MTTLAYQWLFDNAESISIDKRPTVASTITRNNTVRSISRGGESWKFRVRMPDGMPWDENRAYIEEIMSAGRTTVGNVQLSDAGYTSWLNAYQGNCATTTDFVANVTQGYANIELFTNGSISSGNKFAAGDYIQIGYVYGVSPQTFEGNVYTVANATSFSSNTVYLNRPIREPNEAYHLYVGPDVFWKVICVELPQWTIGARNQVFWDGEFVFYETVE